MLEKVKTILVRIRRGEQHTEGIAHVVPLWLLLAVFAALLVFTWLTVAATAIDLGRLNIWIALAIAAIKATLVALYFMHLRYDRPLNGVIFLFAIFFVMLFVGLVLMDTSHYQPELIEGYAPGIGGE